MRELDGHDLSRPRIGDVDAWVRWTVALACLVTFLSAVVVPRVLAHHGTDTMFDGFWFKNALALEVAIVVAFGCLPVSRVARSVRLAVVLPVLHLALIIAAWIGWTVLASRMPTAVASTPLLEVIPVSWMFVTMAAAFVIGGSWIARKRRGEAIHAIVMIALVDLLLLGLWLPIASRFLTDVGPPANIETWGVDYDRWEQVQAELASPARLVALVLVPPFLAALGYTLIAVRRRHWVPRFRRWVLAILAVGWVVTLELRRSPRDVEAILYTNFIPWLLAVATAAVAAITALSVSTWIAARRRGSGAWQQHVGRIAGGRDELVAGYEITSWLRGPRAITSACEVVTARGTIPVPAGVQLVAPLPLASTLLRTGERLGVLHGGDEVALGGYEQQQSGQPFRDSSAPIPGEAGVVIGPADADHGGQLALVAWRPAVAYLVIMVIVAVPALVTALKPM